jgi:glutathione synthase/RimK-type ligase-like ATP-grasp enzyme
MPRIALLTDARYTAAFAPDGDWYLANILHDDRLLQDALQQFGVESVRLDWADPSVDWSQFRAAVFRTTWDYFHRYAEFSAWFDRVETRTILINPPAIIRWNRDKHYLADLDRAGVPIVPTRFVNRGESLRDAMNDWPEAVVKPCVSGGARHTHRVTRANAVAVEAELRPVMDAEDFLVQPFQPAILESGEDSLMLFDGRFTHAVRKNGKPGDFRVQDDFGGTVRSVEPTAGQIAVAERAVAACSPRPVYARVDLVNVSGDDWAVMELELIEPELWLRFHPPAAAAFARGIVDSLR